MRIEVDNNDDILESIKEALEGEIDFKLNSAENMLSIETCGVTAEINKEELYMFIEKLSEIADSMLEGED